MPQDTLMIEEVIKFVNHVQQTLQKKSLQPSDDEWAELEENLSDAELLLTSNDFQAWQQGIQQVLIAFDGCDTIADHFFAQLRQLTKDIKLGIKTIDPSPDSPKPIANQMIRLSEQIKQILKLSRS